MSPVVRRHRVRTSDHCEYRFADLLGRAERFGSRQRFGTKPKTTERFFSLPYPQKMYWKNYRFYRCFLVFRLLRFCFLLTVNFFVFVISTTINSDKNDKVFPWNSVSLKGIDKKKTDLKASISRELTYCSVQCRANFQCMLLRFNRPKS